MMSRRKLLLAAGVTATIAGIVMALIPAGHDARAATAGVTVADFSFTDAASGTLTTTISAGDSVLWTWAGGTHSVTADGGSFDDPAGSSKSSGTFSHTFTTPGTYAYYCRIHGAPGGVGMHGIIVVNAAAATPTASAAPTTPTSTPTAAAATRTPTNTPAASPTAAAGTSATSTPATTTTSAPSVVATPTQGAGAAGAAQLPPTGTGSRSGNDGTPPWVALALGAAGVTAIGASLGLLRRTRVRAP
ncbi:MAG TPA: plastocyanin/azurin family copper-binding protein [Dehalococcoidia bacterium]|nr:plastocyanin/azurin family copper-binding protein [Dehalococcoidia bacterium]